MTRMEALKSYTLSNAFATFVEKEGSLVVGKLANITVLPRDIITLPDDQISETQVTYTM